jgi:multidrug efflux pump subunit AcrA (membrane-fusion protein)
MSRQRFWHWIVLTIGIGIIFAAWLDKSRADSAAAPSTSPSTAPSSDAGAATTTVRRGTLDLSLDFDGTFVPRQPFVVRVNPRQFHGDSGLIIQDAAAPGSAVKKGDVLLTLETDEIDRQIAAAENDLKIAQANLVKAQSDVKLGEQSDELAMADAQHASADADTALKRWDQKDETTFLTSKEMDTAQSDYYVEAQADELDQLRKMYKSEDLTQETADIVVKRAVRMLHIYTLGQEIMQAVQERAKEFEIGVMREALASSAAQTSLSVTQLDAKQTQDRTLRDTALVAAQAAVDDANKKLSDLKGDREQFKVIAPSDGIVVYGSFANDAWTEIDPNQLAVGEKIQPDQIVMTLFTPGDLLLHLQCPESQLSQLAPGAKVTVRPAALPGVSYDGVCRGAEPIGHVKGSGQMFDIPVDLPEVDARLAPGFAADVNFDGGKLENVLLVPMAAVSHSKVWANPSQPQAILVQTGLSDGRDIVIQSGLKEGDVILSQPPK